MAVVSYKCLNCGGPLKFDADKQLFSCEYCLSEFSEQALVEHYKHLDEKLETEQADPAPKQAEKADENAQSDDGEEAVIYICPSCGAEVATTESTAATECYYCHNPVVLGGRLSGELRPEKVVPFEISKEKAIESFQNFCKKKRFLPRGFFSKKQIEKMQGVYFPYWYTDAEQSIDFSADANVVRVYRDTRNEYTEVKKYHVRRRGVADINNLVYEALSKEDRVMLKCVHPYDVSKARDFSMTYLSGFAAEKRDVEKESLKDQAQKDVDKYARRLLNDSLSKYTSVYNENMNNKTLSESWRYTLLPVWVITYKFGGKIYTYAINGQTGKMYGSLPVSPKRLLALMGIIAAIILIIFTVGGFLL